MGQGPRTVSPGEMLHGAGPGPCSPLRSPVMERLPGSPSQRPHWQRGMFALKTKDQPYGKGHAPSPESRDPVSALRGRLDPKLQLSGTGSPGPRPPTQQASGSQALRAGMQEMAGSSLRPRGTSKAITERPQVVSGPWAAPSAKPLVPHSLPRSPRRWRGQCKGSGGPTQPGPECPRVPRCHTAIRGPASISQRYPPPFLPTPRPQRLARKEPKKGTPLEAARGPIQPSDPRSGEPGRPRGRHEYHCAKIPTSTKQRSQASNSERGVDAPEPGGSLCPWVGLSTGVAADTFCPVPWGGGLKHLIVYLTSN